MASRFNADEVFEIAERIEVNGGEFYRKAAAVLGGGRAREALLKLAAMEDEHERLFSRLRAQFAGETGGSETFDPDGEAARYLQAFADGQVFDTSWEVSRRFTGTESAEEIFRTAMTFEKDAIVFLLGIRDLVPKSFGKDKIEELIKEEQRHIVILTEELTALKKPT